MAEITLTEGSDSADTGKIMDTSKTKEVDSSKDKTNDTSSKEKPGSCLKQTKIGFLPRKPTLPTFVKSDDSPSIEKSKELKSPVDNGVKDSTPRHPNQGEPGTNNDKNASSQVGPAKVTIEQLNLDKSQVTKASSKSPISSNEKEKSKESEVGTNRKVDQEKQTSPPTKKTCESTKVLSPTKKRGDDVQIIKTAPKSRLLPGKKGNNAAPVEILSSSDEEDEICLSKLRKKLSPVKSSPAVAGNQAGSKSGKLNQTLEKIYSTKINGPIHSSGPGKPSSVVYSKPNPPPLDPIGTKNIIIAIDMDPQKWKSLSPQEQTKIIEHKKELARKHLLNKSSTGKGMPSASPPPRLLPQNHRFVHNPQQQRLTPHHLLPPQQQGRMNMPNVNPQKSYSSMNSLQENAPVLNSYLQPRPTLVPGPAGPRMPGYHPVRPNIPPNTQMQDFSRHFNYNQFNVKQEESTMTDLKPLPPAKKIPMPPGFPNECFGDVCMVVEFVNAFKSFLSHKDKLTADLLMLGVIPGGGNADVVAQILLLFLKILLSNEDFKVPGLRVELADLPLTEFTVSFLMAQLIKSQLETKRKIRKEEEFARKQAAAAEKVADLGVDEVLDLSDDEGDGTVDAAWLISDDSDEEEYTESKKKAEKMRKEKQKQRMSPQDAADRKLALIAAKLVEKDYWYLSPQEQLTVMSFLMHLILESEDISDHYVQLNDERMTAGREIEEFRKKKQKPVQTVVTLSQFTKKKEEKDEKEKQENGEQEEKPEDEDGDNKDGKSKSGLTRRQLEAIHSEKDKEENKRKERERKELEAEKQEHQKRIDKLGDVTVELRRAMRVEPLGEDRFHRLYWFFPAGLPGLYLSDRCVSASVVNPFAVGERIERWSYYNKEEDINQLLCALTVRGFREEKLKSSIRAQHAAIARSIKELNKLEEEKKAAAEAEKKLEEEMKLEAEKAQKTNANKENEKVVNGDAAHPGDKVEDGEKVIEMIDKSKPVNTPIPLTDGLEKTGESAGDKSTEASDSPNKEMEVEKDQNDAANVQNGENEEEKMDTGTEKMVKEAKVEHQKEDQGEVEMKNGDGETNHDEESKENEDTVAKKAEDTSIEKTGDTSTKIDEDTSIKKEEDTSIKKEEDTSTEKDEDTSIKKGEDTAAKVDDETAIITDDVKDEKEGSLADKGKKEETGIDLTNGEKKDNEAKEAKEEGKGDAKEVGKKKIYDAYAVSLEALKADIIESANRIVHGSLGEIEDLEGWSECVATVHDVMTLRKFVLQIQSCIYPKFFLTPFKGTGASNAGDISKEWCKWVDKTNSLSTMHTLYGLLENSINWESSAEKMRCKVCRRKKGTVSEYLIVCDTCHLGYHMHCLRPKLTFKPDGDWNCPSCIDETANPKGGRSARAARNRVKVSDNESEGEAQEAGEGKEEEEEETDHEEVCHVCESDGTLILCDTCPLSFHLDCHNPPMRHAPRGNWSCSECTNKRTRKGRQSQQPKKSNRGKSRPKYVVQGSSSEDEEDESDGSASDFVTTKNSRKKSTNAKTNNSRGGRRKRNVRNMEATTSEEEEEEEEDKSESESEAEEEPKGRRAKKVASAKTKLLADDSDSKGKGGKGKGSRGTTSRTSRKVKTQAVISSSDNEGTDDTTEPKNVKNLRVKVQKLAYSKKKSRNKIKIEDEDEEDDAEENGSASEKSSSDEDEQPAKGKRKLTDKSPTLGNRRPCYAKDGLRKKAKEDDNSSSSNDDNDNDADETNNRTDDEEEDNETPKGKKTAGGRKRGRGRSTSTEGKSGKKSKKSAVTPDASSGDDVEKKREVARNLSSADRSYRQAGRNSRRGCNYEMEACRSVLTGLRKDKDAWPFLVPVNVKDAPDYLDVIEKPMDLSIVLRNLDELIYEDVLQFVEDVKLMFENSKKYNTDTSPVGEAGLRLNESFNRLLKEHLPEVYETFT